ncbi:hypothetical protein Hanom_Chr10g00885931 [Helianthus anomalus]
MYSTVSRMRCIMCTIISRLPKNYGSLWRKSTKRRMREQRNLLSPVSWTSKWLITRLL